MARVPSLLAAAQAATGHLAEGQIATILRQPTIVVSAPRSGSNLLFESLSRVSGFWSIGGESHGIFAAFLHLRAENAALDSGSLERSHADAATRAGMHRAFLFLLMDHRGVPYLRLPPPARPPFVTWLEKTPRNALNIPFLLEIFPQARFIYLYRDARENVTSIAEAWQAGLQTGASSPTRTCPGGTGRYGASCCREDGATSSENRCWKLLPFSGPRATTPLLTS